MPQGIGYCLRASRSIALLVAMSTLLVVTMGSDATASRHGVEGPQYGGTLKVAYTGDMVTFDPAQAYTDDWWVMNGTLYNGLYQFDRTGQPQLDLAAAAPSISPDRRTWTFHLRRGVRFSNGLELTASDVRFSIMRTLDPKLKPAVSWGQSTDDIFEGSHAYVLGKSTSVPGIQVLDRYTIRFVLAHPVAILPYLLAESFNMVVPRAVVTKESPQYFASHPIGTEPFILQSWQKGSQVVFVRNPHYFHAGKPYLDRVIVYSNLSPSLMALRIEKGELDGAAESIELAPADIQQALAKYLVSGRSTLNIFLTLNVHLAPFTSLAFRRAVAMAIDRPRLVELSGGLAGTTGNLFVPAYPQYDPVLDQHPVYPYNPQKAAALVKTSGYDGRPITLIYMNFLPQSVSVATGIQQDLQQIGINVKLSGVTSNAFLAKVTPLTGPQLALLVWDLTYPDGNDLYAGDLACGVNGPGGTSAAHYCDPTTDALAAKAGAMPLGPARNALLRRAQVHILQSAAYVPLVYLKTIDMVSPRVGGFYYQPGFGWQYENYWIKR